MGKAAGCYSERILNLAVIWSKQILGLVAIYMRVEVLRNPIHLYRIDGLSIRQPAFLFILLPRSPALPLLLNQSLAYRHLLANGSPALPPTSNLFRPSFYSQSHHLEFRTEETVLPAYRFKSILDAPHRGLLSTVVGRGILRKVMYTGQRTLVEYGRQGIDVICRCTPLAYLCEEREIERQVRAGLTLAKALKPGLQPIPASESPSPWDSPINYSNVLLNAYTNRTVLSQLIARIQSESKCRDSLLSYLLRTGGSLEERKFRWKRTLEIKRWSRLHLDPTFTRLLCTNYLDLLSTYDQLHRLEAILALLTANFPSK